jgi:hypothetical protein
MRPEMRLEFAVDEPILADTFDLPPAPHGAAGRWITHRLRRRTGQICDVPAALSDCGYSPSNASRQKPRCDFDSRFSPIGTVPNK